MTERGPFHSQSSPRIRGNFLYNLSFCIFIFGIYTNISPSLGDGRLSGLSGVPGMLMMLPFVYKRIRGRDILLLGSLVLMTFIWAMLAPYGASYFMDRVVATAQLTYSLAMGYILFLSISMHDRVTAAKVVKYTLIGYLLMLSIEVLTPFKAVTLAYMKLYQSGVDFTVINRDIGIAGGHRPKFFTSETSYVAMTATFLIGAYAWLSEGSLKYIWSTIMWVLAIAIIRSPIVVAAGILIAAVYAHDLLRSAGLQKFSAVGFSLAFGLLIYGSGALWKAAEPLFEARLRSIQAGTDYSTTFRTFGSLQSAMAVAATYPITGVGIGSQDIAENTIKAVYVAHGVPILAAQRDWRISLANAFAYSLLMLGYVGSIGFWLGLTGALSAFSGKLTMPFYAMALVLCLSFGAIYTPKFICHLMAFAALNRIVSNSPSRQPIGRGTSSIQRYGAYGVAQGLGR